ncbi:hypothetical protein HCZ30_01425 [Marivivens donghaensis]|uniref:Uncharacterized protein n=1 Tax=Marivivens donghaensis TaxID=1699413 RepID=A0ABX0VT05_9RHOB|nr:hypothetical protein [Marivivens donghaensis]NIY71091.1 hypothetical protein [Marivivens donghaensis]
MRILLALPLVLVACTNIPSLGGKPDDDTAYPELVNLKTLLASVPEATANEQSNLLARAAALRARAETLRNMDIESEDADASSLQ